jgi:hypothetical protein
MEPHAGLGTLPGGCTPRATEVLGRPAIPGVDHASTEIAHCKSDSEFGVSAAEVFCAEIYLRRIATASGARMLVALGDMAGNQVRRVFELPPEGRLHGPFDSRASPRSCLCLPHPMLASAGRSLRALMQLRWHAFAETLQGSRYERWHSAASSFGGSNLYSGCHESLRGAYVLDSQLVQCNSFHSAHRTLGPSGLKPILKPTGCKNMQQRANRRAGFDLRTAGRRRHATPKFESPLPHRT